MTLSLILLVVMLKDVMLSVAFLNCYAEHLCAGRSNAERRAFNCHAECPYVECRNAECLYAECRGTTLSIMLALK